MNALPRDARFPIQAPWIELSASAVEHNIGVFRELLRRAGSSARVGAVLKGNAYGHGFAEMLPVVHALVDLVYVITPQDGLAVRAFEASHGLGRRQVVVLGAIAADEAVDLARHDVDAVIADGAWEDAGRQLRASAVGRRLRCHVHFDTGLGREGFTPAQLPAAIELLQRFSDAFDVVGMLSHFANTEDVTEQDYAQRQLAAFEAASIQLRDGLGLSGQLERHIAASAAAMVLPAARFDAVRVGISLYGLWPSAETRVGTKVVLGEVPQLRPVLSWRCPSQTVKWLQAGSYVGYGCTWRCPEDTRVAVLPLGYFDGYPRLVSGKAHVLVNGHRCAVLGRVMMNHIVVDVSRATTTNSPVVATLIGEDGTEVISADTVATWAQTINYELVARLGAHLRRVVV